MIYCGPLGRHSSSVIKYFEVSWLQKKDAHFRYIYHVPIVIKYDVRFENSNSNIIT